MFYNHHISTSLLVLKKNKENEYLNEINNYKEQIIKKEQEMKSIINKFEKQINELKNDNYNKQLFQNLKKMKNK